MQVKDVMTTRIVSVAPDATILQAARLMLQHHISGLPVIDPQGSLVGVVTEGDFLRRAETKTERKRTSWLGWLVSPGRLADEYTHTHGRKVAEVMTYDPYTVTEDTSLDEVVRIMERKRIKRLPVVRGGKVVGIVSRANLLHALANVASKIQPVSASDEAIRTAIVAEMDKQRWAPISIVNVLVHDGVVEFHGSVIDERDRQALLVMAENTPGVKAVQDHLVWVEPMSGMIVFNPDELPKAS